MYLLKTITSTYKHKHGKHFRHQNGLRSRLGPASLSDVKYIMALSPLSNFLGNVVPSSLLWIFRNHIHDAMTGHGRAGLKSISDCLLK